MVPKYYALASNLLASLSLGALLGLGVYVTKNTLVIGGSPTPGFRVIHIDQNSWNVGCTIVGTAVGILAILGYSQHDNFLTRQGIMSDQGVVALYLRPLTVSRSVAQVIRGQLITTRILLALLTIVSTLSSAATVAIFGVHNIDIKLTNPVPSFPLASYNDTFFETSTDGYYPTVPLDEINLPELEAFLYRAAYIGAATTNDPGGFNQFSTAWISPSGAIGDTSYSSLNTGGIGLNMTSYFDFSGYPSRFHMPSAYTFNDLSGVVYGTHVNVVCVNSTANYDLDYSRLDDDIAVFKISNHRNVNFQIVQDTKSPNDQLLIGAAVSGTSTTDPILTIAVPVELGETFICDCTYSGREYMASIIVSSRLSPLEVVAEVNQGPFIGLDVKWLLARTATNFLRKPGGGSLISAWTSTSWNNGGDNNTDTAALLSTILSQTGEAQLSLLRQTAERSNTDTQSYKPHSSSVTMSVRITMIGSGQYGWLSLYALLLVGALLGLIRTLSRFEPASPDVQDPVKVLGLMLNNDTINDKTRLKIDEKIEVLCSSHL
ncbi:uncharacterized protein TrAFT101_006373 [Trichoderma asperellum]|uniref:Transmembrane protein n=1 Tax=Trichoderma asperellum (strain ATCC 204424 / CBS 433.97 / NBRC 101777) TaxID=1042311 RepID=A0A2T3YR17_TRIA4|nr:hypothetical protein M441DRAFT_63101 [Trichoderma asperellum CBS 433.97]PTB34969.1 hypothetical protein M441DRAFT_63101 [Trichoderma asperellum CBS 433.97]UKZ91392.1 hypothetical protein TrAFT101_006373 [Trichoderma asperellum]